MSWNDLQETNLFNDFNFKKAALVKIALHHQRLKGVQIHIVVLWKVYVLGQTWFL